MNEKSNIKKLTSTKFSYLNPSQTPQTKERLRADGVLVFHKALPFALLSNIISL